MSVPSNTALFLVEGSVPVGTGHLRRCATLARHLEERGWKTCFQVLVTSGPSLTADALASILNGLEWHRLGVAQHSNVEMAPRPQELPLDIGMSSYIPAATLALIDVTPPNQKVAVEWCRAQALPCLALDYLETEVLPDMEVTLMDMSGRMRAAFASAGRSDAYHEGVAYAMLRPALTAQRGRCAPAGRRGVLDAIVSLGGADPRGLTLEAMDLLRPWRNRLDQVTVVLGPGVGHELTQKVRAAASGLQFAVVTNPPNFDALMGAADLVLCNGGGTMLEALCLGRLVAVMPQTDAEANFAAAFIRQGACVWARETGKILETTEQERLEFARRAASIVDGQGLDRLTHLITQLASSSYRTDP